MSSIFILQARILKLSHVTVSYDCCLNTCCCFTGTYAGLDSCPFCKHAWYNSEGHSYKKYKYLLNPRSNHSTWQIAMPKFFATALFQQRQWNWRHLQWDTLLNAMSDTSHNQWGWAWPPFLQWYPRCHSRSHAGWIPDIQSTEGQRCYLLATYHTQLQPPSWNLHAAHTYHPSQHHTGPKAPKDFNSFLHPFVDECKKLATGVWAFDSYKNKTFKLHVYLISVHDDMMAIKYIMNFKGPNGKSPCHACHITGVSRIWVSSVSRATPKILDTYV